MQGVSASANVKTEEELIREAIAASLHETSVVPAATVSEEQLLAEAIAASLADCDEAQGQPREIVLAEEPGNQ